MARSSLSIKKFIDEPCSQCGTPHTVINGAWLRIERETAGLTLREVARQLDYSAAYICDVEHSRRHCNPKTRAFYEGLRK